MWFRATCRHVLSFAVSCALMALAGCMHEDEPPAAVASPPPAVSPQRLDAGDQLRITVFGEDRLTGVQTIESDGRIVLPLAGPVEVAGQTPQQAGERIARQLAGQLVHPRVTVTVIAWRPVYVTGEVERAGQYAWQPGLNLASAMALAGGATRRASRDEVLVQRAGKGPLVAMPQSPETPVYPGDLLKVPERFF